MTETNETKRFHFLSRVWKAYPAMPSEDVQWCGRVKSIDPDSGNWELLISESGKFNDLVVGFKGAHYLLVDNEAKAEFIIIPGDLICVLKTHKIALLAPIPTDLSKFTKIFDFPGRFLSESKSRDTYQRKQDWMSFVTGVRGFFIQKNFLELTTPIAVVCPGTEPTLDLFSTLYKCGSQQHKLFLRTSPELQLKKHLVWGARRIFEIATCFRNGEETKVHRPEFTMLEWYRSFENLNSIKTDAVELFEYLAKCLDLEGPTVVIEKTVQQLFLEYCDFDLIPATNFSDMTRLALKLRVDISSAVSIDDVFFLIFSDKIEPHFTDSALTIVTCYPPYQAALSRIREDGWADRFELYWRGMELANAFHELNSPQEQIRRFQEDLQKKRQYGKEEPQLDLEFLELLSIGMPPSGGIALGLERLFMALHKLKNIQLI